MGALSQDRWTLKGRKQRRVGGRARGAWGCMLTSHFSLLHLHMGHFFLQYLPNATSLRGCSVVPATGNLSLLHPVPGVTGSPRASALGTSLEAHAAGHPQGCLCHPVVQHGLPLLLQSPSRGVPPSAPPWPSLPSPTACPGTPLHP